MKLRPGLLKQHCPDLLGRGCTEARFALSVGKVVINDHGGFSSIDPEIQHVDSCFVDLFCDEQMLNAVGYLSHGRNRAQEIAVPKVSLLNVVWRNAFIKDSWILIDFRCSLPFNIIEHILFFRLILAVNQ
jgi:hypothetical protein